MVYSTCSLNPIENEAVIASLLEKSEGENVSLDGVGKSLFLSPKKGYVYDSNNFSVGNVLLVCKTAAIILLLVGFH